MADFIVTEKRCSTCKNILPTNYFYKCNRSKDGLQGHCIACDKARQSTEEYKTKSRQSGAQYRDKRRALIAQGLHITRPVTAKKCPSCQKYKPIGEFSRGSHKTDGHQTRCKQCDERIAAANKLRNSVAPRTEPKQCNTCNEIKSPSEFHIKRRNKDGLNPTCKQCYNTRHEAAWKLRYQNNKEKFKAQYRRQRLRQMYGMTVEEYDALFEAQGGVCAICGRPPNPKPLVVDHDHITGQVRGLLCATHNSALGLFGEDVEILRNAANYLERAQKQPIETVA